MIASFSAPPFLAYGSDEPIPPSVHGQDVNDALYQTVHSYPGGVTALAARLGMSPSTLTHKASLTTKTHLMSVPEALAVMHMSGNAAALHAMAEHLGYTCTAALPDQSGGDPVQAFMRLQQAFGDLVRSVADPLAKDKQTTRNEMRRAEAMAGDMHTAIGHVLASLRARMRSEPGASS